MCGIGGYAVMTLHLADGREAYLDAPARAGSKTTPDMWEDVVIGPNVGLGFGFSLKDRVNAWGYTSICTPGTVKGLATILQSWGTISWREALEPAIRIAEEGFMVTSTLAGKWRRPARSPNEPSLIDYVRQHAEASRIYLTDAGRPYQEGEILRNSDYGKTLRQLAEYGAEDFYAGDLAARISADLGANGSYVTTSDLAGYQLIEGDPLVGTYRDYTVTAARPPHGGPTLLEALNILEGYDLAALDHNSPEYIYRLAMATKAAFADRNQYLGDPDFVEAPLAWMVSKNRADTWRQRIAAEEPIETSFAAGDSPHTTHVTAIDGEGNAVALTHSLGMGSGVITPGLGFMYNNSMVNFCPLPGHPNSIAPGKTRATGMTPTIISKDGKPVLIIGAPGATRIITSVLQVIVNVLDFGMSVSDAVLAPRFHCEGEMIFCQGRIPNLVCDAVREKHPITRIPESHGGLALVHAIHLDPTTGRLSGAADAGAGGMPLSV
jgi:gamma-glutamyltranspeptidase/glutathione hydrolase